MARFRTCGHVIGIHPVDNALIGSLSNRNDDGNKKTHKFAYLTMKNSIFARFARSFFIFIHFEDVLALSET